MHRTPAQELKIAVTNYLNTKTTLEAQLAKALDNRNNAIVIALDAGVPQKYVAATVGVGREQIRLIAKSVREACDGIRS